MNIKLYFIILQLGYEEFLKKLKRLLKLINYRIKIIENIFNILNIYFCYIWLYINDKKFY